MIGDNSGITVGLALALATGLFVLWLRIEAKFAAEQTARLEMVAKEQQARHAIETDLNAYKVYVSQNHVSSISLKETEERLITAFDRLYNRMETLVARLDRLGQNMVVRDRDINNT